MFIKFTILKCIHHSKKNKETDKLNYLALPSKISSYFYATLLYYPMSFVLEKNYSTSVPRNRVNSA